MAEQKKFRWFVVTNWNMKIEFLQTAIETRKVRYFGYSEEVCPKTKNKHWQMYMYMVNQASGSAKNCNKFGKLFGPTHCNVEPMYGKIWENEGYCSKDHEGKLQKLGDEPKQGLRGDIDETKDMIMKGEITAEDICVANPIFYHQYGRTMEKLEQIALRRKWRTWMTEGIWYTGGTGYGKSHAAFENFDYKTHYIKNLNEDWWDGYMGQEIVILNEFRGQIKFSELLDLVDKWPKNVKWRNRESVPFLAKKVIVTSIKTPEECYERALMSSDPLEQFERRFKTVQLKKWDREIGSEVVQG